MLDSIRRLIGVNTPDPAPQATGRTGDVRLAACVLLLELANADGDFSDKRQRIGEVLQRHFGVDAAGADQLMAEAAVAGRNAVDDFVFTRQVVREYSLAQRMVLAELMWQVVLADGELHGQESYLMRKLANLLQLEPAFLAEARKRSGGSAP
ncbi:MAG: TerB family tellurite resistance protein [Gemmatimonadaceae bacterium]|nr:TerB family tellurite resistance protein [Gemmatimonadaceae bacterium]